MAQRFRTLKLAGVIFTCLISGQVPANAIALSGKQLDIAKVMRIARGHEKVNLDPIAVTRVKRSYRLLVEATNRGMPIYGVNRGVGWNKDKEIFQGSITSLEATRLSEKFNIQNLRATSATAGDIIPSVIVRAAMVIRLNTLLTGHSGATPELINKFVEFLNADITPVIRGSGSVGEADITILANIGLAMIGEGAVRYNFVQMPAYGALEEAHIIPLRPIGRDSLAIMSSNAYSMALCLQAIESLRNFVMASHRVFALSLEGLNGNIGPFLKPVENMRVIGGSNFSSTYIRSLLRGSYLEEISAHRPLQDPLSFKTVNHIYGSLWKALLNAESTLKSQMNSPEDNPAVIVDLKPSANAGSQELLYYVRGGDIEGAVMPTAAYDPFHLAVQIDSLKTILSQVSAMTLQRILKLGNPEFTHLSRFLAPDENNIGMPALQKVAAAIDDQNAQLGLPSVGGRSGPLAGGIEDTATYIARSAKNLNDMIKNLNTLSGIELIHAAQAVDLRLKHTPSLKLGPNMQSFYKAFRSEVKFNDADQPMTRPMLDAGNFLSQMHFKNRARLLGKCDDDLAALDNVAEAAD